MDVMQILLICLGVLAGVLTICLSTLFFVSRKTQKVMQSLLGIMLNPERAKVADAVRVLSTIMADELTKIELNFQNMRDTLNAQIKSAEDLKNVLTVQNDKLVATAEDATKKMVVMSGRLDNTLAGLNGVVESHSWEDVKNTTEQFSSIINELLNQINVTSKDTTERTAQIQSQIDSWLESGKNLSENLQNEFNSNADQMKNICAESETMQNKLAELSKSVSDGFNDVKTVSSGYEEVMIRNDRLLDGYLDKLEGFTNQSKKQLTSQMNTLTNTANVVAGQVRLVETSIEKQTGKLTDIVEGLMSSASATEAAVRGISTELVGLTNRFDSEIKEFATGVVSELKTVSGVANMTLENTKTAANAFSESVKAMATGVRETLIEMNTAHTQLSGQSENLIKMSSDTTEQLQPLSVLIEKYYTALPDLARASVETSEKLEGIVNSLNDKLNLMKNTVSESTGVVSESASKLEDLASESRQQMIDLMTDYAKAVNTMQTLNKQMMVARATAPMDAIKTAPAAAMGHISSQDFMAQSEQMLASLHEQSMDLTRVAGAEIPDVVWTKYHAGDIAIFSKWLAKMLGAADKKRIKDMIKSDTVFRRQATQFVRSFDKVLSMANQTDDPNKVSGALIKTDLGRIYIALKSYV
jgi:ABC-type transporter Mla subunit MlaD